MNKKFLIFVVLFSFFFLSVAVIGYKKIEVFTSDDSSLIEEECIDSDVSGQYLTIEKTSGKELPIGQFNSCGDPIPVLVPGVLTEVNDSSIVMKINQAGYNDSKTLLITEDTQILNNKVSSSGELLSETPINVSDLRPGIDIVSLVIENENGELFARQIKYLIFE